MDNVETMHSANGKIPWHGKGTVGNELLTALEMKVASGLDWLVLQEPIFTSTGKPIEGFFRNYRNTDGRTLGIVTEDYIPRQNDEVFMFIEALLGLGAKFVTAGSLANGKRMWALAVLDEMWKIGDEKMESYFCVGTGHDGRHNLIAGKTEVCVVCQNTYNIAVKGMKTKFTMSHRTNGNFWINQARDFLGFTRDHSETFKAICEGMMMQFMTNGSRKTFYEKLFIDASENTRANKIIEIEAARSKPYLADVRESSWGMIQAISDVECHDMPIRPIADWEARRILRIIDGDLKISNRAFALLV